MSGFSSNNREIPFFSVPGRNRIESYVPFRNASRYLKAKSSRLRYTHELLSLCGYGRNSYGKFLSHQSYWNETIYPLEVSLNHRGGAFRNANSG